VKELEVKLTFKEGLLGTSPASEEVYRNFIGSKAPDAVTVDYEIAAPGADAVIEKGMTVFPKLEGHPVKGSAATLDEFMAFRGCVSKLDDVHLSALLAAARAMHAGKDYEAALSIGNTILVDAGYKPV